MPDQSSHSSLTIKTVLLGFGLLVLGMALFHGGAVWGSVVFCGGDIVNQDYPLRAYWLREGFTTGWYASSFSGYPFFANTQAGVLYPPNWLYWLGLPIERATTWLVLAHTMFGGWGFYRLARRRFDRLPAAIGAFVWMFGGFQILRLVNGVLIFTYSLSWVPWIWRFADECGPENRRATAALALCGAMQFLAGAPQLVHIAWGGLGIWLILRLVFFEGDWRSRLKIAGHFMAAGLLMTIVVFPQLYASKQFASLGANRGADESWEYLTDGSLEPRMLMTDLLPGFFETGNNEYLHWGAVETGFYESNIYPGIVGLLLAGFAAIVLLAGWRKGGPEGGGLSREDRRWVVGLLTLFVVGLLVGLGKNTPLYKLLYEFIPGFKLFRVPSRWQLWTFLTIAYGAAWGAQLLVRAIETRENETRRRVIVWSVTSGVALVGLLFLYVFLIPTLEWFGFDQMPIAADPDIAAHLIRTAGKSVQMALVLVLVVGASGVLLLKEKLAPRVAQGLVVGALVLDLFLFWLPFRTPIPLDIPRFDLPSEAPYHRIAANEFQTYFYPPTDLVESLESHLSGRLFYDDSMIGYFTDEFTRELSCDRPVMFGLQSMRGYYPLSLKSYVDDFRQLSEREGDPPSRQGAFLSAPDLVRDWPLDAYNATHVLLYIERVRSEGFRARLHDMGLRPAGQFTFPGFLLEIWENPDAAGWAWLSTNSQWPGLDERLPNAVPQNVERTADRQALDIEVPAEGLTLHFSEVEYPGWRIVAENQVGERLESEGRSIALPVGRWRAERAFHLPFATRVSMPLSAIVALLLILFTFKDCQQGLTTPQSVRKE